MSNPDLIALATQPVRPFESIPIIDISGLSGDVDSKTQVANAIRDACIHVGFFYVKNHGVDDRVIENAFKASQQLFDLPQEEKNKLVIPGDRSKGYNAFLRKNTSPGKDIIRHESFVSGPDPMANDTTNGSLPGSQIWPRSDIAPGFRDAVGKYHKAKVELSLRLFSAFAQALNLPEDFFADKTKEQAMITRLIRYPPQTGAADDQVPGMAPHTDYKFITILWQDMVSGLQVQNASGQWIDAKPIPGTFIINLGDQLSRWTNDIFKSNLHRAINSSGLPRYSMGAFFSLDYDVNLEALPSCVSKDRPPRYEAVSAGDFTKARLEKLFARASILKEGNRAAGDGSASM